MFDPVSDTEARLARIGQSADAADVISRWSAQAFDSGRLLWASLFADLPTAREFADRFIRDSRGIKLLGIGLEESLVAAYLTDLDWMRRSYGDMGIDAMLQSNQILESGHCLGYEPLGQEAAEFHSYICNSLHLTSVEVLGLSLNDHGRFADAASCRSLLDYIEQTDDAEPALWESWRVEEYPF